MYTFEIGFKDVHQYQSNHLSKTKKDNRWITYQWQQGGWPECSCPELPAGSRETPHCGMVHCPWPWSCTAPPGGQDTTLHCENDIILDHHEIIQFKDDLSALPQPPSLQIEARTQARTRFRWTERRWVSESEDSAALLMGANDRICYA